MKNKIVCSNACAESVRNMYDWAANLPVKTSAQAFSISQSKYAEFTVSYRPISVPALTYALLGSGIVLLALAPASWVFMRKQQYTEPAEKKADK